jgi:hypothetical protein
LANPRPTPNRRRRETSPDEEARIAAFAKQAETLLPENVTTPPAALEPVTPRPQPALPAAKAVKSKSYTFRMTEETLNELRDTAAEEDRSIQWVFDKILLPALRNRTATD